MNAATCTMAVPASTSTADRPMGVKPRQAAAAASAGRTRTAMNSGSRPPSQAPAASRCRVSDAISSAPRLPPIAPAWPMSGCTAIAAPASTMAAMRAQVSCQWQCQHCDQQHQAQQHPLAELRLQCDHRQGMQRHRDAAACRR